MAEPRRLDSWKEIAVYLGRDVRTVLRWQKDRGLPVHRVPGGKLPRVFAYAHELDEWLANRSGETLNGDSPRRFTWYHLAAAVVAAIVATWAAASGWTFGASAPVPPQFAVAGSELRALDAAGEPVWTHAFDGVQLPPEAPRWTHVGDVDDDGRDDVLASLELRQPSSNAHGGTLAAFSASGRLQWARTLDDAVTFRAGRFGPPWVAADLGVHRTGAGARITWAVHHFTWWPSMLVTFDGRGERLGTFVNAGWIRGAVGSADGRRLFVTGVSNRRDAYFLAVLDAARPAGRSPEPEGSTFECTDCPDGDPLAYMIFPRTDVGRQAPFPAPGPSVVTFPDGRVQVQTLEGDGPVIPAVIYELDAALEPGAARLSDAFAERHRELEQSGAIAHPLDRCPLRSGATVETWSRPAGWRTVTVPVAP